MVDDSDQFGIDAVLPAQFFADRGASSVNDPVKRLMLAVLETALSDYKRAANALGRPTGKRWHDAKAWLFERGDGPFAFDSVCESLGIDADWLRAGIRRWDGGQLARRAAVNGNGGARPTLTCYRGHRQKGRI